MSASNHHNHNTVDVTGHITSHYCGDSFTLPPPLHPRILGTQQEAKLNLCQKSTLFLLRVPSHLLLLTVLGLAGLGSSDWAVLHSSQNVCLATVLCCPQPSPAPLTQGSLASTTPPLHQTRICGVSHLTFMVTFTNHTPRLLSLTNKIFPCLSVPFILEY